MNDNIFGLRDSIGLNSYAVMMILAIVSGGLMFLLVNKKFKFTAMQLLWLFIYCIIFGLLGARFFSVLFRLGEVFDPNDEMRVIDWFLSGWMYYGGVLGGLIGIYILSRKENIDYYKSLDMCAIILPLAHAVGRVGCYLSGCCYGKETHSHLGVIFDVGASHGATVYPTNLYEVFFNGLLFLVIVALFLLLYRHKMDKYKGLLTSVYFILYPIWRFLIEYLRGDSRGVILYVFSTSQFISIFLLAYGIYLMVKTIKRIKTFDNNKESDNNCNSQQIDSSQKA